jgi:hypothetical protein
MPWSCQPVSARTRGVTAGWRMRRPSLACGLHWSGHTGRRVVCGGLGGRGGWRGRSWPVRRGPACDADCRGWWGRRYDGRRGAADDLAVTAAGQLARSARRQADLRPQDVRRRLGQERTRHAGQGRRQRSTAFRRRSRRCSTAPLALATALTNASLPRASTFRGLGWPRSVTAARGTLVARAAPQPGRSARTRA